MVKKKTENQSIAEAVLRCRVGSANAASKASGGSASISARSEPAIASHTSRSAAAQASGTAMCWLSSWRRQRHSVHRTSSQVGHANQPIILARLTICAAPRYAAEPIGPGPEGRGRGDRQHGADGDEAGQAPHPRLVRDEGDRDADHGEQQGDARRTARGQHRQRDRRGNAAGEAPVRARGEAIEVERDGGQLGQLRRRLVAQLQQAEAGDQGEQGAVGDGPRVVDRRRLAAEGERQRLCRFGAGQVVAPRTT